MKRKKLMQTIAEFLDRDRRKQHKHREELTALLEILAIKEAELEEKLRQEQDARKQHRLSKELDILKAQHAKGMSTLQDLDVA